jgi:hypothetical protein
MSSMITHGQHWTLIANKFFKVVGAHVLACLQTITRKMCHISAMLDEDYFEGSTAETKPILAISSGGTWCGSRTRERGGWKQGLQTPLSSVVAAVMSTCSKNGVLPSPALVMSMHGGMPLIYCAGEDSILKVCPNLCCRGLLVFS